MDGSETKLKPYIVVFPGWPIRPILSADGKVLIFQATAYKPDGSGDFAQLFQYSPDGKHRRITYLPPTEISDAAVTNDGEMLAIVCGEFNNNILICQVKDGTSRAIKLPNQPSRFINSQ
jgi:tricorn protease-like protein